MIVIRGFQCHTTRRKYRNSDVRRIVTIYYCIVRLLLYLIVISIRIIRQAPVLIAIVSRLMRWINIQANSAQDRKFGVHSCRVFRSNKVEGRNSVLIPMRNRIAFFLRQKW